SRRWRRLPRYLRSNPPVLAIKSLIPVLFSYGPHRGSPAGSRHARGFAAGPRATRGMRFIMVQGVTGRAEDPLRVGVVGVGVMGSNHARVLAGLPGVQLIGVADPDRQQARFVAGALGTSAVDDLEALLPLGVDAVTIAAPTHLHHDIALTCIQRG